MKTHRIQILIEAEKGVEEDAEVELAIEEMSCDIQAYLESMKQAVEPLWQDVSFVAVKANLNK